MQVFDHIYLDLRHSVDFFVFGLMNYWGLFTLTGLARLTDRTIPLLISEDIYCLKPNLSTCMDELWRLKFGRFDSVSLIGSSFNFAVR